MSNPQIRAPYLYMTRELIVEAHDKDIKGIVPDGASINKVLDRGSLGALRGLAVSRLVLHNSADISDSRLRVYRLLPYESGAEELATTSKPGIHPNELRDNGLPEVHTLVVAIKEFDEPAAAWGLHKAASDYAQTLEQTVPDDIRGLRTPDKPFNVPFLDTALNMGIASLGKLISNMQPEGRRESPESLASQLQEGLGTIIGRGVEGIEAVQNSPDRPPLHPMRPDEMATLVEQAPPLAFKL